MSFNQTGNAQYVIPHLSTQHFHQLHLKLCSPNEARIYYSGVCLVVSLCVYIELRQKERRLKRAPCLCLLGANASSITSLVSRQLRIFLLPALSHSTFSGL